MLDAWQLQVGQSVPAELIRLVTSALTAKANQETTVECGNRIYTLVAVPIPAEGCVNLFGQEITENRRTEESLRGREADLARAQAIAHLGSWNWDVELDRFTASDELHRIHGVERRPDLSIQDVLKWIHPDDAGRLREAIQAVYEHQPVPPFEYRLIRPDGTQRVVLVAGIEVDYNAEGKPIHAFGTTLDITERRQAAEALRLSEEQLRLKLNSILSPLADITDQELSNILDIPVLQALLDAFYKVTGVTAGIVDLKGKVLATIGWQDICARFHRVHPETARNCVESDAYLTSHVKEGECVAYKCKNLMWDVVTPLFIGGKQMGNVLTGQFFYENEPVDLEQFAAQARQYQFDPDAYLAALQRVPRRSPEEVQRLMDFLVKLTNLISKLSYSNLKLARVVTEQRRIEAALRESEDHFRQLVKRIPIPVGICDERESIRYLNDRFTELFGYTLSEIPTLEAWRRRAHPDESYRQQAYQLWQSTLAKANRESGKIELHEYRVTCRDGTERIVEIFGTVIKNNYLVLLNDITERRQAEEKLQQAVATWDTTFNAISDSICVLNKNGVILQCNEALARLLKRPKTEIVGRKCHEMLHGTVSFHPQCPFQRMLQSGQHEYSEITLGHGHFAISADPVSATAGPFGVAVHIVRDITDQKRAEKRLQELAAIVDFSDDAVIGLSSLGKVTSWNRGAARIFGYTEQEMIGQPVLILTPAEFQAETKAVLEKLQHGEGIEHFETLRQRKDGKKLYVSLSLSAIRNDHGELVGVSGIARDITERKQVEEALRERKEELERFERLTVGRELKMIELKSRIKDLEDQLRAVGGTPRQGT